MDQQPVKTVYVIDDEPADCLIAQRLVELFLAPIHVEVFYSVSEPIMILSSFTPNSGFIPSLILLDINLPGQDGWDFIDQYKQLPQYAWIDCKIVMLTSSIHKKDQQKVKDNEIIADLLIKPFTREQITEKLLPLL